MGDKIRTAVEIAMEKAEKLYLTKKEKEQIEIKRKIDPILAKFFKRELSPKNLWKKLKDERKPVLKEIQAKLVETIIISLSQDELKRRKNAILAVENLKKNPGTVYVEKLLNSLEDISKNYLNEKQDFYNQLKTHIENNPNLLVRQINSGGKKMAVRISPEEAINQSRDWQDFTSDHEEKFTAQFLDCLKQIKEELGV